MGKKNFLILIQICHLLDSSPTLVKVSLSDPQRLELASFLAKETLLAVADGLTIQTLKVRVTVEVIVRAQVRFRIIV